MSNLIKSVYFQMEPEEARVIDSDSRVVRFVPGLLEKKEDSATQMRSEEPEGQALPTEAFQDGMHILNMEDVRQEEREKVQQEVAVQTEKLLEDARAEADGLLAQARAEADSIRQNAYDAGKREGYAQGQEMAQGKLKEAAERFQQQMAQQKKELKEQELALEPKYAEIMASLIEKITGVLCQDRKETIVYLIHQALNQLEKTKSVNVRVSKADVLRISGCKEELKQCLSDGVELEITEDESLGQMQCILETDSRIIDCSLDVQLQNLRDQIRMLTIL